MTEQVESGLACLVPEKTIDTVHIYSKGFCTHRRRLVRPEALVPKRVEVLEDSEFKQTNFDMATPVAKIPDRHFC